MPIDVFICFHLHAVSVCGAYQGWYSQLVAYSDAAPVCRKQPEVKGHLPRMHQQGCPTSESTLWVFFSQILSHSLFPFETNI